MRRPASCLAPPLPPPRTPRLARPARAPPPALPGLFAQLATAMPPFAPALWMGPTPSRRRQICDQGAKRARTSPNEEMELDASEQDTSGEDSGSD